MIKKENLDKTSAWPFVEAKKLLRERKSSIEKKGKITLQTGYGPSGLPHIGTFGEVARTSMMVNALNQLSDYPTEIITFSDDMDGLRKVPDNIPNQKLLNDNLHKPLTQVPDPFEKFKSFGEHNNEMLKTFLNSFNFKYSFKSSTSLYRSGFFNSSLQTGYGPSGLPHIGTFGEVARTSMMVNALNQISDFPTEIITFSDDMDGLRKDRKSVV